MNPTAVYWLGETAGFGSVINAALNIFIYSANHQQLRACLKAALLCRGQPIGLDGGLKKAQAWRKKKSDVVDDLRGKINRNIAEKLPTVG